MAKKRHPFDIRSLFILKVAALRKLIKQSFWIVFISILIIELFLKRFHSPNHTFFVAGAIYLKLCYSILAATIFYFINQHLPKEDRKLKALPFMNNALVSIHSEVLFLVKALSIQIEEQNFSKLKRRSIDDVCKKINPQSPVYSGSESSIPFKNWYEYFNYKASKIKALTTDLLPLNDIIDTGLMEKIYLIHIEVSRNIDVGQKRFANNDLSYWSSSIWHLIKYSEDAIRSRGKNYKNLEREHQSNFIKNNEASRYLPNDNV